jgi:hypothetical protein
MNERIKLIWDFHGPNAYPIAQHHAKHLDEFAKIEALQHSFSGSEQLTEMHAIAFLVVEKKLMNTLREQLKPNRGQVYTKE